MDKESNRRAEYSIPLLCIVSVCIGLLTVFVVLHAKTSEHRMASIGEAVTLLELTNSYVSTYSSIAAKTDQAETLVPAKFRATAARHFNNSYQRADRPVAVMVGLAGREINTPPIDDDLGKRLAGISASGEFKQFSYEFDDGAEKKLRTVFPTVANQENCIACHNRMQPDGPRWAQGDLMGAYVVDQPIGKERQQLLKFSIIVGILSCVVSLFGGYLYIYSRRLHAQSQKLRLLAYTDSLTGCMNRRALINAFERGDVQQPGGALFVIDLDHFKLINDNYGHEAGDLVLVHFTRMVREQLREGDLLARIGGEEFVVFLPDTTELDAHAIAQRTRSAINQSTVRYESRLIRYTVSIGAVLIPSSSNRTLGTWLLVADRFLYRAKQLGRNQVFPSHATG